MEVKSLSKVVIFRRSHSQTVDDRGWSHEVAKIIPLASRMWIVGQTLG